MVLDDMNNKLYLTCSKSGSSGLYTMRNSVRNSGGGSVSSVTSEVSWERATLVHILKATKATPNEGDTLVIVGDKSLSLPQQLWMLVALFVLFYRCTTQTRKSNTWPRSLRTQALQCKMCQDLGCTLINSTLRPNSDSVVSARLWPSYILRPDRRHSADYLCFPVSNISLARLVSMSTRSDWVLPPKLRHKFNRTCSRRRLN